MAARKMQISRYVDAFIGLGLLEANVVHSNYSLLEATPLLNDMMASYYLKISDELGDDFKPRTNFDLSNV